MSTLNELTEVTEVEDTDYFYMRRAADVDDPDKRVAFSHIRPNGARIESFNIYDGIVTIPDIAGGGGNTITFELTGAREGDFIVPNWTDGMPTGLGIVGIRVSDIDEIEIRIRNFAGSDFEEDDVPLTALLIRAAV